ncbi:pyridoxamine 5'-phosphate oxidase family protein [Actinomadura sp. 7K534]|uniref:pyridoxamine 5'-phosphate oxidase family protein n=1 Tax=Actinomadura sp. 7K534 TaxID=2530366 RepID=UPI001045F9B1|nr:pyridoxamine 5'-phosphate oxidase family protein [Actinomadura sp. 7K534]TDB86495.1 pyridoxamine 5'-phosphate oxidase family protein [Actinomadura sp. 7K534]
MTDREPAQTRNLDIYGNGVLTWDTARAALREALPKPETPVFLGTVRPDGRPHAAGVGALWHDGDLYFTSGPGTRKSRDLAANPACTLSVRAPGVDLVLEGEAVRVTDPAVLEPVAAGFREGGWPARVDGGALTAPYSAQSAGPPPWHLYRLTFRTAAGVATAEPFGASRWRFDP